MECKICGKNFIAKSHRNLTCSLECSSENKARIQRESYLRKKDGIETERKSREYSDYVKLTDKESRRLYRERHKEKIIERNKLYNKEKRSTVVKNRNLKKDFGLTLEQFNSMLESQNFKCKICKKEETAKTTIGETKTLAVDHCHQSGKIRGLLCSKCNRGLGFFQDSQENLLEAIKYLQESEESI